MPSDVERDGSEERGAEPDEAAEPTPPPDDEDRVTYADTKEKQDEFEQLLRERDDFQEATDAQLAGEPPEEDPEGGASL